MPDDRTPLLAVTQGDPAGIGPELLLGLARHRSRARLLLIAERSALEAAAVTDELRGALAGLEVHDSVALAISHTEGSSPTVFDPTPSARVVRPGEPGPADAVGALAALDQGIALARSSSVDALVTAPVNKATISRHVLSDFRGHTDYLAAASGLLHYGREYLMTFVADDFRVALLNTHLPLRAALDGVTSTNVVEALVCLDRHLPGHVRIAVAGLNPHAGEGGLLGSEDRAEIEPAVARARDLGVDAHGPFSPDSIFSRCRAGEFDWVLAMYHDQGLIAIKTVGFGDTINWTLGLPFVRTSVDHGTAYEIAGQGRADSGPLVRTVERTVDLLSERRSPGT